MQNCMHIHFRWCCCQSISEIKERKKLGESKANGFVCNHVRRWPCCVKNQYIFLNQNLHAKRVEFSVKEKVCFFKSTKMAVMPIAAIQQKRAKNYK